MRQGYPGPRPFAPRPPSAPGATGVPTRARQVRAERCRHEPAESSGHTLLEFGLRATTLVRDTTDHAWADAEAKVARTAAGHGFAARDRTWRAAVGQQRLLGLAARGDVLDDNLHTAPGRYGGGGAGTTWLVGSAEDVARSLRRYQALGVTHFVLSDTPHLPEIRRQGHQLLPLLHAPGGVRQGG